MKDLIEFIARMLVDQPADIEVLGSAAGGQLELRVSPEDLGRVVGRRGRTAKAMRVLLRAARQGSQPCELEICSHAESGSE